MRLTGKQICCSRLLQLALYVVCCLSLFKSSLNWVQTVAGKVAAENWSVSAQAWAAWRCGLQTLCCWQKRVRARWANQLLLTSPVAKKRSVDRPIRTESTESVIDFSSRWQRKSHGTNRAYWRAIQLYTVLSGYIHHNDKVKLEKLSKTYVKARYIMLCWLYCFNETRTVFVSSTVRFLTWFCVQFLATSSAWVDSSLLG